MSIVSHLLQSTIFAAVAALLTLLLRNNHARARYWVWLAASVKFLVPFSIFVELGHRFTWTTAPVIAAGSAVAVVIEQMSQPFSIPQAPVAASSTPAIFPSLLFAIWICGAAAVLIFWVVRWFRVAASLRAAAPLTKGREFESLRRLGGTAKLLSAASSIEPGVFGILRPVLSLPAGMTEHLDDAQLDAIIAHELSHIRRRDNLTAAIHMLVEAMFWFHPLVWWVGTRLVKEREQACDEEVVRLGGDPEVYAESILKICRYYLASPLPCAAGISGSDLKNRIESIMTNTSLTALSGPKKIMLGAAGLFAIVTPLAIGAYSLPSKPKAPVPARVPLPTPAASAAQPQLLAQAAPAPAAPASQSAPDLHLTFEAASIRPESPSGPGSSVGCSGGPGTKDPERVTCTRISALYLITQAWNVNYYQLVASAYENFPAVDVMATMPAGTTKDQYRIMLRNLLTDRFKLALHSEIKDTPVYEMVVGKSGTKAKPHGDVAVEDVDTAEINSKIGISKDSFPSFPPNVTILAMGYGRGRYQVSGETMETVCTMFSNYVDRPVIDKTGLAGKYDFSMNWMSTKRGEIPSPDTPSPTFQQAIEDQLGFRLIAAKDPIDVLVVDHMEKTATEN